MAVALLWIGATSAQSQSADSFNPGVNGYVLSVALQPDGKVLLGGRFTTLADQPRNHIGRLNPDGTLDAGFNPGADSSVSALAVQPDGGILVGGGFQSLGGQRRSYLGRLLKDGSLDAAFDPGADNAVNGFALQPDGKILVAGSFNKLGGQARMHLGRLNSDGSLDTTFDPGASGSVFSLAVQPDGKILVGGDFGTLSGQPCPSLGRLNPDGSLDTTFNAQASYQVFALAVQGDGRIVVGGYFYSLGGQSRNFIGRVNSDGSLDAGFNPGANQYVSSLAVQADGGILVGGNFTTLGGKTCKFAGRLTTDGTLDTNFNAAVNGLVEGLAVQADGKILLGGYFSSIGGQPRTILGRLNNTAAATDNLSFDGDTISWLRNGTAPGLWWTSFDGCTNGTDWFSLGLGERVGSGWQLSGVSAPAGATIRARGCMAGGLFNKSAWFVETSIGPPAFNFQPTSVTNNAETTATFTAVAAGTPPLGYQWLRNGVPLTGSPNVIGVQTPTLNLNGVLLADQGDYALVVANAFGSVTSRVATLTVCDPYFASQPGGLTNDAGTIAVFTVAAGGSSALTYRWLKDGLPMNDVGNASGTRSPTLTLTNVLAADRGLYSVCVSNLSGSVTSRVAVLAVCDPAISVPPTDQAVDRGQSAQLLAQAAGTQPIAYQWFKDGTALPGATAPSLAWANAQGVDAGYYQVVASNQFGHATSGIVALNVNLALVDAGFAPADADGQMYALAVQAGGKILVGGDFLTLGGQMSNGIGRLNEDGSADATFIPGASGAIHSLALQADSRLVIGGERLQLGTQTGTDLGRLNPDGSLDRSFNPGSSGVVSWLQVHAGQKLLVGGYFASLGGQARANLGRLNEDGTPDTAFNSKVNSDSQVLSLAAQADGKLLVGRFFSFPASGYTENYIQRLMPDGSSDTNFNVEADGYIGVLTVQADGKILAGGEFTTLNGQNRMYLGRLNVDGTLDSAFSPALDGPVNSLALQADGKVLVGGSFTRLAGQARNHIGRLNADGTLDLTFNPSADGPVSALAIQPDGKVVAIRGRQAWSYLSRVVETEPAVQQLVLAGSTLTWFRGGTAPEVWRVCFESSADGTNWVTLGEGTRIPGGWQVACPTLQTNVAIRARGFVAGAERNGSGWVVESTLRPYSIQASGSGPGSSLSGAFGFNAGLSSEQSVVLEVSTNLIDWSAVATNHAGTVPFQFKDPESLNSPQRFYRARVQ